MRISVYFHYFRVIPINIVDNSFSKYNIDIEFGGIKLKR